MPIPLIAGAIAGIGAIGASVISSKASNKATDKAVQAQTQVADTNNALQREIYGQNSANLQPFMQRGNVAGERYNALLGLGGDQQAANDAFAGYRGSTGYDFRVQQGNNALNTGWAGRGTLRSGAAGKSFQNFGQGIASQEFGNYLGQLNNQQQMGLSGANALAGVGTNFANASSANNQNAADAISNAALVNGQNTANVYGTAANALGNIGGAFASSFAPKAATPNLAGLNVSGMWGQYG